MQDAQPEIIHAIDDMINAARSDVGGHAIFPVHDAVAVIATRFSGTELDHQAIVTLVSRRCIMHGVPLAFRDGERRTGDPTVIAG